MTVLNYAADTLGNTSAVSASSGLPVSPAQVSFSYKYTATASSGQDAQRPRQVPATLLGGLVWNVNAAVRYLKVYNQTTVPASTDTPVITVLLPAGTATVPSVTSITDLVGAYGRYFSAGIAIRLTTGVLDNDATAVTAGDVIIVIVST